MKNLCVYSTKSSTEGIAVIKAIKSLGYTPIKKSDLIKSVYPKEYAGLISNSKNNDDFFIDYNCLLYKAIEAFKVPVKVLGVFTDYKKAQYYLELNPDDLVAIVHYSKKIVKGVYRAPEANDYLVDFIGGYNDFYNEYTGYGKSKQIVLDKHDNAYITYKGVQYNVTEYNAICREYGFEPIQIMPDTRDFYNPRASEREVPGYAGGESNEAPGYQELHGYLKGFKVSDDHNADMMNLEVFKAYKDFINSLSDSDKEVFKPLEPLKGLEINPEWDGSDSEEE